MSDGNHSTSNTQTPRFATPETEEVSNSLGELPNTGIPFIGSPGAGHSATPAEAEIPAQNAVYVFNWRSPNETSDDEDAADKIIDDLRHPKSAIPSV